MDANNPRCESGGEPPHSPATAGLRENRIATEFAQASWSAAALRRFPTAPPRLLHKGVSPLQD